jgi:hypothetical protein
MLGSHVVIHLQIVTPGAKNQANREGASRVNGVALVLSAIRLQICRKAKAGV